MKTTLHLSLWLLCTALRLSAQCPTCGNGTADAGETAAACPQDVPHTATCASPCGQSTAFEAAVGIRQTFDFSGTTTYGAAALPAGWAFGSAPTPSTAGTLAAAGTDTYGAKAGLVQPGCSGSCGGTNGFCITNIGSSTAVGSGGSGGKLGANFDGRANINQNTSYAVLRGVNNPTLVSPTFNFSAVEGFKLQIWLAASESSCGQGNGWGSCTGNNAFLDFSANGGTSWSTILTLNLSSTNSDMCSFNTTNTLWIKEGTWSRVCITVFRSATSPGNFYTAANSGTAASGIMVSNTWFTNNFKYRIRYAQSVSCTGTITATNPGRYLAIDYPVITSGNEMIPCGISFANYCGYGADNNDDGVGSTGTTTTVAHTSVRRSPNQAERGVEIFTSQNASFAAQNLSGSNFTTNFDLCNAEGGDRQCINWNANNNFYNVVYECVADWEAGTGGGIGGINTQYYKGTTPASIGMTKVTTAGKTALIGWRYTATRFVSCSSTSDLNPGCNGYSFISGSLPTQFARTFYHLVTNASGESWSFYGASSCSHYFNGPFFAPIALPDTLLGSPNYTVCNASDELVFTGTVDFCATATGFSGNGSIAVSGPGGFAETIAAGAQGLTAITTEGDYIIKANAPGSPTQCLDCGRTVCVTLTAADLAVCSVFATELTAFEAHQEDNRRVWLHWQTALPHTLAHFTIERSTDEGLTFVPLADVPALPTGSNYEWLDAFPAIGNNYYRLRLHHTTTNEPEYSNIIVQTIAEGQGDWAYPNPAKDHITVFAAAGAEVTVLDLMGKVLHREHFHAPTQDFPLSGLPVGVYMLHRRIGENSSYLKMVKQ